MLHEDWMRLAQAISRALFFFFRCHFDEVARYRGFRASERTERDWERSFVRFHAANLRDYIQRLLPGLISRFSYEKTTRRMLSNSRNGADRN